MLKLNEENDFKVIISTFPSVNKTKPSLEQLSVQDFAEKNKLSAGIEKKDLPCFSFATYNGGRAKKNVIHVTGICLDYDKVSKGFFNHVVNKLEMNDLISFTYTTSSHKPKQESFRVAIPLAAPVGPDGLKYALSALAFWLNHDFKNGTPLPDTKAFDASRLWFFGKEDGQSHIAVNGFSPTGTLNSIGAYFIASAYGVSVEPSGGSYRGFECEKCMRSDAWLPIEPQVEPGLAFCPHKNSCDHKWNLLPTGLKTQKYKAKPIQMVAMSKRIYSLRGGKLQLPIDPEHIPVNKTGSSARGWQLQALIEGLFYRQLPLHYDTFKNGIADETTNAIGLQKYEIENIKGWVCSHYKYPLRDVLVTLEAWLRQHQSRNSVVEFFESLPAGDGTSIQKFAKILGLESAMEVILLQKWLVSAVARAYEPGCRTEGTLVVIGPQGNGKTTTMEILGGQYFNGTPLNFKNKDKYLAIQGCLIKEFPELAGFSETKVEDLKAFITSEQDTIVPKYENSPITLKRTCVFVGTSNEKAFLRDPTGNRRFWPVSSRINIDLEWVRENRNSIWGDAVTSYKAGYKWWIDKVDEAKLYEKFNTYIKDFQVNCPIKNHIIDTIENNPSEILQLNRLLNELTPGLKPSIRQLSKILRSLGYEPQEYPKPGVRRGWVNKNPID